MEIVLQGISRVFGPLPTNTAHTNTASSDAAASDTAAGAPVAARVQALQHLHGIARGFGRGIRVNTDTGDGDLVVLVVTPGGEFYDERDPGHRFPIEAATETSADSAAQAGEGIGSADVTSPLVELAEDRGAPAEDPSGGTGAEERLVGRLGGVETASTTPQKEPGGSVEPMSTPLEPQDQATLTMPAVPAASSVPAGEPEPPGDPVGTGTNGTPVLTPLVPVDQTRNRSGHLGPRRAASRKSDQEGRGRTGVVLVVAVTTILVLIAAGGAGLMLHRHDSNDQVTSTAAASTPAAITRDSPNTTTAVPVRPSVTPRAKHQPRPDLTSPRRVAVRAVGVNRLQVIISAAPATHHRGGGFQPAAYLVSRAEGTGAGGQVRIVVDPVVGRTVRMTAPLGARMVRVTLPHVHAGTAAWAVKVAGAKTVTGRVDVSAPTTEVGSNTPSTAPTYAPTYAPTQAAAPTGAPTQAPTRTPPTHAAGGSPGTTQHHGSGGVGSGGGSEPGGGGAPPPGGPVGGPPVPPGGPHPG